MRIAIDIDSTLHHYWDVLSESSKRRFGVELPYDEQVTWGITRLKPKQLEVCIADTHRGVAGADRPAPRRALVLLRQDRALRGARDRRPHRRLAGQPRARDRARDQGRHDLASLERRGVRDRGGR